MKYICILDSTRTGGAFRKLSLLHVMAWLCYATGEWPEEGKSSVGRKLIAID